MNMLLNFFPTVENNKNSYQVTYLVVIGVEDTV